MSSQKVVYIAPDKLHIIGLDDDHTGEGANVDALYDERVGIDLDENFVRNIMVYGINSPVLCRNEAGRTVVIDGRQRVRAAREANRRFNQAGEISLNVPVIMVNGSDRRVQGIMISANEQRQDDGVMVKAKKAVRMLSLTGSKDEVCVAFGKTIQTINAWIRLVNAITEIHEAVEAGTISATAAIELAGLPREEQKAALERALAGAKTNAEGEVQAVTTATAKKARKGSSGQPYAKKAWLKKAMNTSAYDALLPAEKDVIIWITTGEVPKGSWMDSFVWNAECEIEERKAPAPEADEEDDDMDAVGF